jgi:hypothetical protein
MATSRESVEQSTPESFQHHGPKATGYTPSPSRGERLDGTDQIPDRQVDIRDR